MGLERYLMILTVYGISKILRKLAPSQGVITRLREKKKKKKIRSLSLDLRKLEDYYCQSIRPEQVRKREDKPERANSE